MTPRLLRAVIVGAAVLAAAPASAASFTIGDFFYDTDPFFGPIFSISNFSDVAFADAGGTFTDLTVDLFDNGTLVLESDLGPLAAGGSIDTGFLDLSQLTFDSARLNATISLAGAVSVAPIEGIVFSGSFFDFTGTGHIDSFITFTPQAPPDSVPEPATLILTLCGAALLTAFRLERA